MSNQSPEKTLVIAEKPSVAADLVKALGGKFKKEKTHYEGDSFIVSYAVGHLVTICEPGEMDENYKSWKMGTLPILPKAFLLKPIPESKGQLGALSKLIRRKDVNCIINACDAGREGELIFRYILEYTGRTRQIKKPIQRLWLQSMTQDSIKRAFKSLRSDAEMQNLAAAASSRSEADWVIGINASRGLTAYNSKDGGFFLTPCGRVQTPTLSMIVQREQARLDFIPRDFYKITGEFSSQANSYEGQWFNPGFKKDELDPHKSADRIWNRAEAEAILEKIKGKTAQVEETTKPSSKGSPPLYDLTSLQREANNRFGYSAKRTLGIAQSLYERYKVLTYPRTDSRFLPEDYFAQTPETFKKLTKTPQGKFAQKALSEGYLKNTKRIFDNSKISDHHAIIPTGVLVSELPEAEAKIYTMVLQRYIAIFFPPAEYSNTTRITSVENEFFKTEGKVLLSPGWLEVYGKNDQEKLMEALPANPQLVVSGGAVEDNTTKPPARYTESTLLSAMEGAGKFVEDDELAEALKERGLGTPATRAAIIEKLISDKYVMREGKELLPTRKSFDLLKVIYAMKIEDLSSPELTGEWEQKLNLIEKNELSKEEFMDEIKKMTLRIVEKVKTFDEETLKKEASFSPLNGMTIFEYLNHYEAADGSFRVRKILGGRHMTDEELVELIQKGQIGPLEGFISKKGSPFAAVIKLEEGKVQFVFDNPNDVENVELKEEMLIGTSFLDQSPVYETDTAYISKSSVDGESTGLRLNKAILGKTITKDQAIKLIQGEKTDLISGFRSSKTKRLFDAYLQLSKKGRIEFSFPPRAPKGSKKSE